MSSPIRRKTLEAALVLAALALFAHYARGQWAFTIEYARERLQLR